jgi:hypothetical protein
MRSPAPGSPRWAISPAETNRFSLSTKRFVWRPEFPGRAGRQWSVCRPLPTGGASENLNYIESWARPGPQPGSANHFLTNPVRPVSLRP